MSDKAITWIIGGAIAGSGAALLFAANWKIGLGAILLMVGDSILDWIKE